MDPLTLKGAALGKILSRRAQEVLSQIIVGKASREIADFYGIDLRTVAFHRGNVTASPARQHRRAAMASASARAM